METRVVRGDVLRAVTPERLSQCCLDAVILGVGRRGKSVVVRLSGAAFLVIQPRFTGAVLLDDPGTLLSHDLYSTIEWLLADGGRVRYRDVRRLGTVTLLDTAGIAAYDARLGEEPLDPAFTSHRLSELLSRSRAAVKKVLMDQRVVAGVGNIYANEALWMAGIDPSRSASSLSADQVFALHHALVRILVASIGARGTTFRDYRDPSNRRGDYAAQLHAYGRGGAPCTRCGTTLAETHAIDGRSTVFCYRCQG